MKLERVSSPIHNQLLEEYWGQKSWVESFFPYRLDQQAFVQRAEWLETQTYKREQLVQVIRSYMAPYQISPQAEQHLQQLQKDAFVVVGGQQAGILTGPLFSIYKAVSVLLIAKQQSDKLNVPVVPLFWIAGEDNDIDEINHTYTMDVDTVKKRIFGESLRVKKMASEQSFDKEQLQQYVRAIFKDYGETTYTQQLLKRVLAPIETVETYTAYFTALMNDLFTDYGLLFVDAAYAPLRELQADYFEKLIVRNEHISQAAVVQEGALTDLGFTAPLQLTEQNANLFYVQNGERFLLERKGDEFVHTPKGIRLTKEQLVQIARTAPQQLSNNVVTRPIMQEMTMPVLTFVGGPGELAYWATLKTAFEAMDLRMPIFVPRLSVTVVGRQAQYAMQQADVTLEDVFEGRIEAKKDAFIEAQKNEALQATIAQMEQQLMQQYDVLQQQFELQGVKLADTLSRNEAYHAQQFEYLKRKLHQFYEQKHEVMLRHMNIAQAQLLPLQKPQERLYNIYQIENEVGSTFIEQLLQNVQPIDSAHHILYI